VPVESVLTLPARPEETTEITRVNWWRRGVDYARLGGSFLRYHKICNKALIEDFILSDLLAIRSGKQAESAAGFPDLVQKLLPP
jgi:hypothetical protein